MAEVRDQFGMKIVTEAIDNESLELVEEYADVIQIGARNMQNFSLLKRAGRTRKPVLLKRGMSATLEEFLMAAEYVMSEGNYNVILCERGVRTFADHTRNTLDLSLIPAVQRLSHLPIVVDPSHGTGKRNKVTPLSRAAVAVGADGLIIEVHHRAGQGAVGRHAVAVSRSVRRVDGAGPADCAGGGQDRRCACRRACRATIRIYEICARLLCCSTNLRKLLFIVVLSPIVAAIAWLYFHEQQLTDYGPAYHEYAYVTNGKSNTVSVIDLRTFQSAKTIKVGSEPTGIAANSKKNEIYVVNAGSNNISVIDAERQRGSRNSRRARQALLHRCFCGWEARVCGQLRLGECFRDRSGKASCDQEHSRRRFAGHGQSFTRWRNRGGEQSRGQHSFSDRCSTS